MGDFVRSAYLKIDFVPLKIQDGSQKWRSPDTSEITLYIEEFDVPFRLYAFLAYIYLLKLAIKLKLNGNII